MKLSFLGAAGEVTGSCYLIETADSRFLVDCGMFQGGHDAERKNREALHFDVRSLDFVLLTHAHLDHSALLPRLVARGFRGPIHLTTATATLLPIMLKDSAHIHEKEAIWETARLKARRGPGARHASDVVPFYTVAQAEACTRSLHGHDYDSPFKAHPKVEVCLRDAGHILGSAIIEAQVEEHGRTTKLVFSGDLGQPSRPVVRDPARISAADVLLVESTYGNRNHRSMQDTMDELVQAIEATFGDSHAGNVIVPAFALGRTQDLLVMLAELTQSGRLSDLEVFVDSPLAAAATQATLQHADLLDAPSRRVLGRALRGELPIRIHFTESVEDSKALNAIRSGAIIIAASGMCDAGRIKHHLVQHLGRAESTILFTGFQAGGTLGRRIVDGARSVSIFQEEISVRARVCTLGGLSAHADQRALLAWLDGFERPPHHCFVVHGEPDTAALFADLVRRRPGWCATVPAHGATVEIA